MIHNREYKIEQIIETITTRISDINTIYRSGPSLYFYKRLQQLRRDSNDVVNFLDNNYHIEILYATLVAWDMNSRAAKMKYFDEFKQSILSCIDFIEQLQAIDNSNQIKPEELITTVEKLYNKLHLMKTSSRLVSNSKLLHFLFPKLLMPMDRRNTLKYFYESTHESVDRYVEITNLSYEIMGKEDWSNYLDDGWNTTVPKIIDNAIILVNTNWIMVYTFHILVFLIQLPPADY